MKTLTLGPLSIGLKNPFSGRIAKRKSWSELHSFFNAMTGGSSTKSTINSQIQEYRSWVYIATSVIYRRVGEIDYKFYRIDTDEEIEKGTPVHGAISRIFIDPNPFMEFRFLKTYVQLQLDLTGHAFLLREDDGLGLPYRLWPLDVNTFVRIEKGDNFRQWIKGFTFLDKGRYVTFPPEKILYFHYPHPEDPRVGCSPVKSQAYAINVDHYIEVYESDFFKNSARPDFLIRYPDEVTLDDDDVERFLESWKKKFGGEKKYHEPGVLDRGGIIETLTPKNEDLALMFLADWSQNKVLASYNVPAGKVGIVKDVNKANAEGIDITFNSECIRPRLQLQDEVFTRGILQRFDPRIQIKHNNPVPRDRKLDIEEHKEKVGVPTWTLDEARKIDNKPPLPDGKGNAIALPLNYMLYSLEEKELLPVEPPDEDEEDQDNQESIIDAEVREIKLLEEKTGIADEEDFTYSKEWLDKKWENFKIYTEAWESIWRTRLTPLFNEQQEEVIQNLEREFDKVKDFWHYNIIDRFEKGWNAFIGKYAGWSRNKIAEDLKDNLDHLKNIIPFVDEGLVNIAVEGILGEYTLEKILSILKDYIVTKQNIAGILFDWDKNLRAFDRTGHYITGSMVVDSANEQMKFLGLEGNFTIKNNRIRGYVGDHVRNFSQEVLSTKANQLRRTLTQGFNKGEDVRRLSDRVKNVYKGVVTGGYEATRIARTETVSGVNKGTEIAYEESGIVEEKAWVATRDNRTRGSNPKDKADHLHMDGQRVPVSEPFIDHKTGARMMHPGDTSLGAASNDIVLCRCTIVPYLQKSKKRKGASVRDIAQFRRSTGLNAVGPARVRRKIDRCYR